LILLCKKQEDLGTLKGVVDKRGIRGRIRNNQLPLNMQYVLKICTAIPKILIKLE
jgi:hypothetical protein